MITSGSRVRLLHTLTSVSPRDTPKIATLPGPCLGRTPTVDVIILRCRPIPAVLVHVLVEAVHPGEELPEESLRQRQLVWVHGLTPRVPHGHSLAATVPQGRAPCPLRRAMVNRLTCGASEELTVVARSTAPSSSKAESTGRALL